MQRETQKHVNERRLTFSMIMDESKSQQKRTNHKKGINLQKSDEENKMLEFLNA